MEEDEHIDWADRKLVGIEYPGDVRNPDAMIRTLGGIVNISKTCNNEKKRMDLRFHPDNVFCKPLNGDIHSASGMLVKIKRRRYLQKPTINENMEAVSSDTYSEPEVSVLGVVKQFVKFDGICDYQYVPLATDIKTNETKFIHHDILPKSVVSSDWLHDENAESMPFFLPPAMFTRVDSCQDGMFKKEAAKATEDDSTIIGLSRHRRFKHASYIPFGLTAPIPEKPHFQALRLLKYKFVTTEQYNCVKEHFEKQPIWLRSALSYETGIPRAKLKVILPSIAYYYTTGPWRLMWVRFGYDARKDFTSRYYQTLDYRIRTHALKLEIGRRNKIQNSSEGGATEIIYPYFEGDRLPQTRQVFYRYCDVHVPKIKEMLDKIPSPLSGATCNEKTGWLPPNFDDNCREILSETIRNLMEKLQPESEMECASGSKGRDSRKDIQQDNSMNEEDEYYEDEDEEPEMCLQDMDFDEMDDENM